jgi:putative nucleotidyltransferase with HDIG domain
MRLQAEPLRNHPHLKEALTQMYPVYVIDAQRTELSPAERAIRDGRGLRSILYIPLLLEEKGIGAMILGSTSRLRDFTTEEIDLCRILAYQITLAVANARLFRSVQQTNIQMAHAYDATLMGWSLALEMRDQETQGHTRRVTQLAEKLASRMGVVGDAMAHLWRGALLHDIGKMSIPDRILKKDGPLNDEEWAIMRKHPEYAYEFLVHIDYLQPALEIPYSHHEKWDGTGYPRGLKGEEIPLSARIFALVDVFDALTSDRPYRKAWSKVEAVTYIRDQSGKHFDPCAVAAFLKLIEEPGN